MRCRRCKSRNQRAKGDRTYHLVISFRSGEDPSRETLAQIEDEFAQALGYGEHQRVSVVHRDTDNVHLHVAINKIHPTRFTLHEPFNDYHTRAKLCQKLETRYGLQPDGATSQRDLPVQQKAAAMERVAGVESLIGYVQRSLRTAVVSARSWQDLHEAFAKAGVALKARGNGLVVESNGKTAKASSCFRELSKSALEKRLGQYQESSQSATAATPRKTYSARPLQEGSARLYERYQAARIEAKRVQSRRIAEALAAHRQRTQHAKAAYNVQRAIIGLTRRGTVNTIMLQLHRANLKAKGRRQLCRLPCRAQRHLPGSQAPGLERLAHDAGGKRRSAGTHAPASAPGGQELPSPDEVSRFCPSNRPRNSMSDPTTNAPTSPKQTPPSGPITAAPTSGAPPSPRAQTTEADFPSPPDSLAEPPLYCSPVLAALEEKDRPDPSPACETCPVSMWFTTSRELKCFCARMNLIVWDRKSAAAPIRQCDGRETALVALAAKQAKARAKEEAKAKRKTA